MAKGKYEKWLEPDGLLCLEAWARDGLIDEQIASNMGVSLTSLKTYKQNYPSILTALKRGKEPVDIEVENALLKKALGFKEKVTKGFKVKNVLVENGTRMENEEIVMVEEDVYIPPDTVAQIFWLKNRKPEQWRDKREIENTNNSSDIEALKTIFGDVKNAD